MRFTPRFSITNAIAAALTEIERARGFLDAASLSDEWIDSMRSRAFLLEAHHTTHIEGTRLTIPAHPSNTIKESLGKSPVDIGDFIIEFEPRQGVRCPKTAPAPAWRPNSSVTVILPSVI